MNDTNPAPTAGQEALTALAVRTLTHALASPGGMEALLKEERSIRQPDSWLVEQCWRTLAETGQADSALVLASLVTPRQPLAVAETFLVLAQVPNLRAESVQFLRERLNQHLAVTLMTEDGDRERMDRNLIMSAVAATTLHLPNLAYTCLEKLDQTSGTWSRLLQDTDLRPLLAQTVAALPVHPLTRNLVLSGLVWHDQSDGARFLKEVADRLNTDEGRPAGHTRMLELCLEAVRGPIAVDLGARRYIAAVLARGGDIRAVAETIDTLAAVMEAQSETRLPHRDVDDNILRHVVRSGANTDVDFQVFTLQEALRALPSALHSHPNVAHLAQRLVDLARHSDGWTAASATAALTDIGQTDAAARVVAGIPADDIARSDAVCELVDGCLAAGRSEQAAAQVREAWSWISNLKDEHLQRLTVRRLAELYARAGHPDKARVLLTERRRAGFWHRLWPRKRREPEEWLLSEDWVRLLCLLADPTQSSSGEARARARSLAVRAPLLLEGEALAIFQLRMMPHLVAAGQYSALIDMLPGIAKALSRIKGQKHAVRTRDFAMHLATALAQAPQAERQALAEALQSWTVELWQTAAQAGIWQAVYSVAGCLALVQALAGARAVLDIGRFALHANREQTWGGTVDAAVQELMEAL